jgi:hypothetical protein
VLFVLPILIFVGIEVLDYGGEAPPPLRMTSKKIGRSRMTAGGDFA